MSNLGQIRLQEASFHTGQGFDWLDGLPLIASPGQAAVVAGAANVGNGGCVVGAVDAGAAIGTQIVRVSGIAGGLTYLSVTDLDGVATGAGVVGAALYAGGVTLTVSPGTAAYSVGDTFAVSVLPLPVDLTGFVFSLDARLAAGSATVALAATSDPLSAQAERIANGGLSGTVAMAVPRASMARVPPGTYVYAIAATEVATGRRVPAFYGTITHQSVLQPNA